MFDLQASPPPPAYEPLGDGDGDAYPAAVPVSASKPGVKPRAGLEGLKEVTYSAGTCHASLIPAPTAQSALCMSVATGHQCSTKLGAQAVVEFVKERLQPSWKAKQIDRDAFRLITRKVTEKVPSIAALCGAPCVQFSLAEWPCCCMQVMQAAPSEARPYLKEPDIGARYLTPQRKGKIRKVVPQAALLVQGHVCKLTQCAACRLWTAMLPSMARPCNELVRIRAPGGHVPAAAGSSLERNVFMGSCRR